MTLNKYKQLKVAVLIIILSAILFIVGIFVWNMYLKNNPDKVFLRSIISELKEFDIQSIKNKGPLKQESNILVSGYSLESVETDNKENIEYVNISWDSLSNIDKLESFTNLLVNVNNEKVIDTDIVTLNNNLYVNLKDTFNKYIEIVSITDRNGEKRYTDDEARIFAEHLLNSFKQSLKKEYFVFNKQAAKENGRNIKLNTVSLKLDNKRMKEISINIVQNIKNNGYIVERLAETNGLTKLEQYEEIEKYIEEMEKKDLLENTFELNISVSVDFFGNMKQVKIDTNEGTQSIYKKYKNVKEYILSNNNEVNLNIKSLENSDEKITTIIAKSEDVYLEGEIKSNKVDKYSKEGEYNIYTKNKEKDVVKQLEIKGSYTYFDKQITKINKLGESRFDTSFVVEIEGKKTSNINIKYNNNKESGIIYVSPKLSNVVKLEDLTPEDYERIANSLNSKSLIDNQQSIIGYINKISYSNQEEVLKKAKYAKLQSDRLSLEMRINLKIAEYMNENDGKAPVIIVEGNTEKNNLKIDLEEGDEIFNISSSGYITYKPNMTAEQFIEEYGIESPLNIPEWVVLK